MPPMYFVKQKTLWMGNIYERIPRRSELKSYKVLVYESIVAETFTSKLSGESVNIYMSRLKV